MDVAKTQYKINSFNRSSRCECILTCGMRLHTQRSSLLVRHQDMPTSGLTYLKNSPYSPINLNLTAYAISMTSNRSSIDPLYIRKIKIFLKHPFPLKIL